MDKNVYEVELACAPGGRLIQLVEDNNMKVWPFEHLVQPISPLKDTLALLGLTVFLKKNPYHIVHTHNSKSGFLGRLAAKLAGIPVIVHTVHGFAFHDQEPLFRQSLFRNLERLSSHWCDKMIFISQPLIDWALQEKITDEGKIEKVYSGIQLDQFRPVTTDVKMMNRKKWKLKEEDLVIGIVSKLWEGKGHITLIEAFRALKQRINNAKLVIVGEGDLYEELLRVVDQNGLSDSVLFTGFQADVSEILSTFDVAVLPSFFEGMGRVLLEAMAMEKPVVASNVGGIPDLVEHQSNGLLVKPGNAAELTDALERILSDRVLSSKMGKEGRKRIQEQFSSNTMVQSIDRVYRQLLTGKGVAIEN
jgi:glycosyltransferase involved in cell wall biosynthesis